MPYQRTSAKLSLDLDYVAHLFERTSIAWKVSMQWYLLGTLHFSVIHSLPVILEYLWPDVGSQTQWAVAEAFFSLNIITFQLSSFPDVLSLCLEMVIR